MSKTGKEVSAQSNFRLSGAFKSLISAIERLEAEEYLCKVGPAVKAATDMLSLPPEVEPLSFLKDVFVTLPNLKVKKEYTDDELIEMIPKTIPASRQAKALSQLRKRFNAAPRIKVYKQKCRMAKEILETFDSRIKNDKYGSLLETAVIAIELMQHWTEKEFLADNREEKEGVAVVGAAAVLESALLDACLKVFAENARHNNCEALQRIYAPVDTNTDFGKKVRSVIQGYVKQALTSEDAGRYSQKTVSVFRNVLESGPELIIPDEYERMRSWGYLFLDAHECPEEKCGSICRDLTANLREEFGLGLMGAVGDTVHYDNTIHQPAGTFRPQIPGEVRIIKPGVMLRRGGKEAILIKALVEGL